MSDVLLKVKNSDISVDRHMNDGFILHYLGETRLFSRRYSGYGVKEAKELFKEYIREEWEKENLL